MASIGPKKTLIDRNGMSGSIQERIIVTVRYITWRSVTEGTKKLRPQLRAILGDSLLLDLFQSKQLHVWVFDMHELFTISKTAKSPLYIHESLFALVKKSKQC